MKNLSIEGKKNPSQDSKKILSGLTPVKKQGLSGLIWEFLETYFKDHDGETPHSGLYHRIIRQVEKPLIEKVLKEMGGNQKKASELLGVNRNTLRKKIEDLEIKIK